MNKIEGKIKNIIYQNDANGYLVALFRVSKSDDEKYLKKTITINGNFLDLKLETNTLLEGDFVNHEKYGEQFNVINYEYVLPTEEDDIIELSETKAAEETVSRLLDALKEKDPELFFQMDSAIGRLARAYEKQGFVGGLATSIAILILRNTRR